MGICESPYTNIGFHSYITLITSIKQGMTERLTDNAILHWELARRRCVK